MLSVRIAAVMAASLFAASCASGISFIPTSGPSSFAIRAQETVEGPEYGLVQITPAVTRILAEYEPRNIAAAFANTRPPEIRFGIGDVISVTIFEAAAGGLFIPAEAGVRPGNFVQLPNQSVDQSGNISVPYAGLVPARDKTPSEVQQIIVDRIRNRAIEPQAVVALTDQRTSLISVLGEVNAPNRFPANSAGERLLDAITRAGGPRGQGYETWITLERRGRRATMPFGNLVYEPDNNIWAHPGDTIYVYREPQIFLAFGASGQQGQFPFERWKLTLSEAIAKAGGLLDVQSDPGSVFLYRREPRAVAEKLGIDCSKFEGPTVPVVYAVSFKDPAGYFLATKFAMRSQDIVFAANAQSVEVVKFLQFIRVIIATANDGVVAANNAQVLKLNTRQ